MKKFISILLILALCISIFSFSASAIQDESSLGIDISKYTDSELDMTQITMEDILSISPEEYSALIREFERVYDPYGAYEEPNQSFDTDTVTSPYGTSTLWTSGKINDNYEWEEIGCHENISAIAYTILANDKGVFYDTNSTAKILAMLHISYASLLPDKDENWVGNGYFVAHFYNPDTQKNYLHSTKNTARTQAVMHYDAAIELSKKGAPVEEIFEKLGRCLHYVQDACEPHHAANITAANFSHGEFEKFAFQNMNTYLDSYQSIHGSYYTMASNLSMSQLVHTAAVEAFPRSKYVNNVFNKSQWDREANTCLKNAARYSTMVLYKFGMAPSVPFYWN